MKKKELAVYRKKQIEDLRKILEQKAKDSDEAFLKVGSGQEKNTRSNKNIRRDIAQILTIIREKEIISTSHAFSKKEGEQKEESIEKQEETKNKK